MDLVFLDKALAAFLAFSVIVSLAFTYAICKLTGVKPVVLAAVVCEHCLNGNVSVRTMTIAHLVPITLCVVFDLELTLAMWTLSFIMSMVMFYIALYNPRGLLSAIMKRAKEEVDHLDAPTTQSASFIPFK